MPILIVKLTTSTPAEKLLRAIQSFSTSDQFHYLYKELDGDFILTANFKLLGKGVTAHRKVGWMVRKSADEDEPHFSAALHGDGLTVGQFRDTKGTEMDHNVQLQSTKSHYQILQIERSGNTYTFRAAKEGEILEVVGSHEMNILSGKVLVGLFVCSHNPDVEVRCEYV